jgi:hypothetical protein
MLEKRRENRRDRISVQLEPIHRERILDLISRMKPWDQFALPQFIGGDIWYSLSIDDRRDLGRHMRVILDEEFPELEVVAKSRAPLRYRLYIEQSEY